MLLRADARRLPLANESVQMVITSPPYFGLRDYQLGQWIGGEAECAHAYRSNLGSSNNRAHTAGNVSLEKCPHCDARRSNPGIGLESSLDEYLANLVAVFREVKRVLHPLGTVWLNCGDAFAHNGACGGGSPVDDRKPEYGRKGYERDHFGGRDEAKAAQVKSRVPNGLKPKDLMLLPARVALALQADGWWLRSDIIFAKVNPMPESVTDRLTRSYEHVFLLAKKEYYFFDAEAIKQQVTGNAHSRGLGVHPKSAEMGQGIRQNGSFSAAVHELVSSRNCRDVWTIPSEANTWATCRNCHHTAERWPKCRYCGSLNAECSHCHGKQVCPRCGSRDITSHYAAFPQALVEPCVMAGTSEKGVCARCGNPRVRVIEIEHHANWQGAGQKHDGTYYRPNIGGGVANDIRQKRDLGWKPSCTCNAGTRPAIVLDPFCGSGTALVVAQRLGRRFVGVDLSPDYLRIAQQRTRQLGLGF